MKTLLDGTFAEKKTMQITAVVEDEKNVPLPASEIVTLKLTLFKKSTEEIINNRDASDIKNTGGGTIDASGNLTLTLSPDDMVVLDPKECIEAHIAFIEWTYTGAKAGGHEIEFVVENLTKVT